MLTHLIGRKPVLQAVFKSVICSAGAYMKRHLVSLHLVKAWLYFGLLVRCL